jgi:thioredoxin 2
MEIVTCRSCGARLRVPVVAKGVPRCPRCETKPAWLVAAGDTEFPQVLETSVPVLVDLWAPWCGPCRMVAPALVSIAQEMAGELKVVKVNVDEAPRAAATFDARSIPTLVILRDGKVIARQVGALPEANLRAWVRSSIGG